MQGAAEFLARPSGTKRMRWVVHRGIRASARDASPRNLAWSAHRVLIAGRRLGRGDRACVCVVRTRLEQPLVTRFIERGFGVTRHDARHIRQTIRDFGSRWRVTARRCTCNIRDRADTRSGRGCQCGSSYGDRYEIAHVSRQNNGRPAIVAEVRAILASIVSRGDCK